MIKTGQRSFIFNTSVLTAVSVFLILGSFFLWKKNLLNFNQAVSIIESSIIFEKIDQKDTLKEGREKINRLEINTLKKNLEEFILSFSLIDKKYTQDIITPNDLKEVFETVSSFSSLTTPRNILKVTENKITKFNEFTNNNNWKTLTRMSQRALARVSRVSERANLLQYTQLHRSVRKEVSLMNQVTRSSLLSQDKKDVILFKLNDIEKEMDMLSAYIKKAKVISALIEDTEKKANKWKSFVRPQIAQDILVYYKKDNIIVMSVATLLIILVISIFSGLAIHAIDRKRDREKVEEKIEETIRNGILSRSIQIDSHFSEKHKNEISKYHRYIQRRMNFSSIFQESFPFPSIMIDENMNIMWSNHSLKELFSSVDPQGSKKMRWEDIKKCINIGQEYSFADFFEKDIFGVYQIMIRSSEESKPMPYEMYVSPNNVLGQKTLMLFFYPLISMEETIKDQIFSVISPIKQCFKYLSEGSLNKENFKALQKEFQVIGHAELFNTIMNLHHKQTSHKERLLSELNQYEMESRDHFKMLSDSNLEIDQFVDEFKNLSFSLKHLKDLALHLQQSAKSLYEQSKEFYMDKFDIKKQLYPISTNIDKDYQKILEVSALLQKLNENRTALKRQKEELRHLIHSSTSKGEIKEVQRKFKELDKNLSSIDINLSKCEMTVGTQEDLKNSQLLSVSLKEKMQHIEQSLKEDKKLLGQNERDIQNIEKQLDKFLKKLFSEYKTGRVHLIEAIKLLEQLQTDLKIVHPQVSSSPSLADTSSLS